MMLLLPKEERKQRTYELSFIKSYLILLHLNITWKVFVSFPSTGSSLFLPVCF